MINCKAKNNENLFVFACKYIFILFFFFHLLRAISFGEKLIGRMTTTDRWMQLLLVMSCSIFFFNSYPIAYGQYVLNECCVQDSLSSFVRKKHPSRSFSSKKNLAFDWKANWIWVNIHRPPFPWFSFNEWLYQFRKKCESLLRVLYTMSPRVFLLTCTSFHSRISFSEWFIEINDSSNRCAIVWAVCTIYVCTTWVVTIVHHTSHYDFFEIN